MIDTLARIHELVDELAAVRAVYSAAYDDARRLPEALALFPSTLIYPGPDTDPAEFSSGQTAHTYEVKLRTFFAEGGDVGHSAYQGLGFVDAVIAKFAANVTLGGRVGWIQYRRQSGFVQLQYNAVEYLGIDIDLELREVAAIIAAPGS